MVQTGHDDQSVGQPIDIQLSIFCDSSTRLKILTTSPQKNLLRCSGSVVDSRYWCSSFLHADAARIPVWDKTTVRHRRSFLEDLGWTDISSCGGVPFLPECPIGGTLIDPDRVPELKQERQVSGEAEECPGELEATAGHPQRIIQSNENLMRGNIRSLTR
jgi:hypothetical protein